MEEFKIGIIGFGTVGTGVAACLLKNGEMIGKRAGMRPVLTKIADLDVETDRGLTLPENVLTTDPGEVIAECDVVAELVGGTTKAKEFILEALANEKPVVTANKALLAEHGEELFVAAEKSEADIYYEASVGGGIPIIKAMREGLIGNRIECIYGILNGTCNYILTRMEAEEADFEPILEDAQELGYAEAEPSLDIDGIDTAHKAAILSSLAYGEWFGMDPIHVEGVRDISLFDLKVAAELGYRVKMLAIIKQENGDVQIRVHPTLVPKNCLLADVDGVFNAVMVKGDPVGETMFYGRGAGRDATASAVVADLVDVGLNRKFGSHRRVPAFRISPQLFRNILAVDEVESRYYVRLQVKDKPGVIAKIANILGTEEISISSFIQKEGQSPENVSLLILTHAAVEKSVNKAIAAIIQLDEVRGKATMLRIEDI